MLGIRGNVLLIGGITVNYCHFDDWQIPFTQMKQYLNLKVVFKQIINFEPIELISFSYNISRNMNNLW